MIYLRTLRLILNFLADDTSLILVVKDIALSQNQLYQSRGISMKTESRADPSNLAKEMKHDRKPESKQAITYVQIVFNNNSNITEFSDTFRNMQIHIPDSGLAFNEHLEKVNKGIA